MPLQLPPDFTFQMPSEELSDASKTKDLEHSNTSVGFAGYWFVTGKHMQNSK